MTDKIEQDKKYCGDCIHFTESSSLNCIEHGHTVFSDTIGCHCFKEKDHRGNEICCETCENNTSFGCGFDSAFTSDCLENIGDTEELKYTYWEPMSVLKNPFDTQVGGSHYKVPGTMDTAEWSKRRGHCPYQYNIIKYTDRFKKKNGIQDLRKAKQYLEFLAYVEYNENL